MKNGKLLTEYLDECAEMIALMKTSTIEAAEEVGRQIETDRGGQLWRALLRDGWTVAELDEAYYRRFGFRAKR